MLPTAAHGVMRLSSWDIPLRPVRWRRCYPRISVSTERLQFRVPQACPKCAAGGTIQLEHTIHGPAVELKWCCAVCNHAWFISADERELTERRRAPERRRVVRKDRRHKR